jgi:dTDP-glucose 4,6-dehydratase
LILVTGGAGFIGANFVLDWFKGKNNPVGKVPSAEPLINLDALTYAGNRENLKSLANEEGHTFVHGDICDTALINRLLSEHKPRAIVHFAAESHVDRSIHGPQDFIRTNIEGTFNLLQCALAYWKSLNETDAKAFRFLHVSTDEVYGSLGPQDPAFTETTPYQPNSPYSASKAASDHLVRAWHHTYGLPVLTTNCSNNYGPYQFPEKLIPLVIANALSGKPLPIYGDGMNIRDWLFVGDHCAAIRTVLEKGRVGEVYNIGGWNEMPNIEIVKCICQLLDEKSPATAKAAGGKHEQLIAFVKDRPGHDRRYAINAEKIANELGWKPAETFQTGIAKTVEWYLTNQDWVARVQSGAYREWIQAQYCDRALGQTAQAMRAQPSSQQQ